MRDAALVKSKTFNLSTGNIDDPDSLEVQTFFALMSITGLSASDRVHFHIDIWRNREDFEKSNRRMMRKRFTRGITKKELGQWGEGSDVLSYLQTAACTLAQTQSGVKFSAAKWKVRLFEINLADRVILIELESKTADAATMAIEVVDGFEEAIRETNFALGLDILEVKSWELAKTEDRLLKKFN